LKISEFFQETGSKQLSSTRLGFLAFLFAVIGWVTYEVAIGKVDNIAKIMTPETIGLILILAGLKGWQKGKENGNGKAVEKPNP
jgi:hypothetical protein